MTNYLTLAVLVLGAVLGLVIASRAVDASFYYYGLLFFVSFSVAAYYVAKDLAVPTKEPTGYNDGVVRAGVIATVFWGLSGFSSALLLPSSWPFRS